MSFDVLMVAPTSFFGDYGGHIRILEETEALQRLGHRVTIVTYYKGKDVNGLAIRRTPPLPWRADYEVGSSRHKLVFDAYLAATALGTAVRRRPHIIHGHMHEGALIGGALARLLGAPLVFDFQGSLTSEMLDHHFISENGRLHTLVHWLEKGINRLPQAILTSSVRARRLLRDEFGVPEERIQPLPDCANLDRFDARRFTAADRATLRAQWGIPQERPVVAYLGLLADYQGTPDLIQAAAYLKADGVDAHFLIMGYPRVEAYRELAARLGVADRVTLPGRVSYDEAPLFLSVGDVAVSAKVSATEGSGKVLNYMAMGQPIVAYDTAVHREYLDEHGVYAPPGDAAALARAIADLLASPARRRELGDALRRRAAQHYSWDAAAIQISDLYGRLVERGR